MGEKGKDGSGCPLISYPGAATGRCKPWQGAAPEAGVYHHAGQRFGLGALKAPYPQQTGSLAAASLDCISFPASAAG